jgi:hypothetical protein
MVCGAQIRRGDLMRIRKIRSSKKKKVAKPKIRRRAHSVSGPISGGESVNELLMRRGIESKLPGLADQ